MNIYITDYVTRGQQSPLTKYTEWSTDVVTYDSKKEQRNQIDEQPRRRWILNWEWLDETNRNRLIEIFNRARGRYDTFFIKDDDDYACDLAECSIDGVDGETEYQLVKTYHQGEAESWDENKRYIVQDSATPVVIKVNGTELTEGSDYTIDYDTGIVTFIGSGTTPGTGDTITASYQFYFKVRFASDSYKDVQHQIDWWESVELEIIEVIE